MFRIKSRATDLMAGVDWERHGLGPPERWHPTLRTMIYAMLGSPHPMYLVWGPERTFFFNDPYIPILGPRIEHAMGARFEELWFDSWEMVAPAFLKAESAGESTQFVDVYVPMARYGEPEDTTWTFSYSPVRDDTGAIVGVLCLTNETTEAVRKEEARAAAVEQQNLLNRELIHRVKNTMAMVQAIASQTLRGVEDRALVEAFQDRLVSLAQAHDVLIAHDWKPASITAVVRPMLDMHGAPGQVAVEGPDLLLESRASLSLSMLLHELGTNAAKYGALSTAAGQVSVRWEIEGDEGDGKLVLHWRETGGPPVTPPTRKGFGSRLTGLGINGGGATELAYDPAGFRATFATPLAMLREE